MADDIAEVPEPTGSLGHGGVSRDVAGGAHGRRRPSSRCEVAGVHGAARSPLPVEPPGPMGYKEILDLTGSPAHRLDVVVAAAHSAARVTEAALLQDNTAGVAGAHAVGGAEDHIVTTARTVGGAGSGAVLLRVDDRVGRTGPKSEGPSLAGIGFTGLGICRM